MSLPDIDTIDVMKLLTLFVIVPALVFPGGAAVAQLDSERSMRNPALAPRARSSGESFTSEAPQYIPLDRQANGIERQQRKNRVESRHLEYRTNLSEYSRERQQVRDRAYRASQRANRDVEFVRAALRGNSESK